MENPFKTLDRLALSVLADKLDDTDLISLCKSDKTFNIKICNDDSFWERRLKSKYPLLVEFFITKIFHGKNSI